MDWVRIVNLSFQLWGSALSLIAVLCLMLSGKTKLKSDRFFLHLIILNMCAMLMDALALYFRGGMSTFDWFGVRTTNFLQFTFNNLISATFLLYQRAYIKEKTGEEISKFYTGIMLIVTISSQILLFVNLFCPFMYIIDEQNLYSRLPLYPLVFLSGAVVLVLSLVLNMEFRHNLALNEKIPFVLYTIIPFLSLIAAILVYGISFGYFGTTAAIVVMFIFIQSEQGKKLAEKETELMQSRVDTLVSQIQPHFLYNILSSISILCKQNPELASQAADSFAVYLRANLDSVKKKEPILLEEELKHVENYVWLEKLRFGDDLVVSYDIEPMPLYLPAVSLQPLVENAILHGMMGKEGVCHIQIKAREREDYAEIIITDDGVGFDVKEKKEDGRSHVGMENVRKRLDYMVGGIMKVESAIGEGTKVFIRIPKR